MDNISIVFGDFRDRFHRKLKNRPFDFSQFFSSQVCSTKIQFKILFYYVISNEITKNNRNYLKFPLKPEMTKKLFFE